MSIFPRLSGSLIALLVVSCGQNAENSPAEILIAEPAVIDVSDGHGLVPKPRSLATGGGVFTLSNETVLNFPDELSGVASVISEDIQRYGGISLARGLDSETANTLTLQLVSENTASLEAYQLSVTEDEILISAPSPAGIQWGSQTLFQLTDASFFDEENHQQTWKFQTATVVDTPRFEWRGLMLDVSRHFFEKEVIFRMIDRMAQHKLNILHLHLTDDPGWRIEIEKWPRLAEVGGRGDRSDPDSTQTKYFTQEDLREIVAYAARRSITVIPEIDMPGHAGAMGRAYPEFSDGNVSFNPGNLETYEFVEDIFTEVMDIFPSQYIHFGADELRDIRWAEMPEVARYMEANNISDFKALEGHFDNFVADFLVSTGRTPVAWDEAAEHHVDRKTVILWWRRRQPEMRDLAIELGHRVVITPSDHLYLDYPQALGEPGAPWEGNDNGPNSLELIYDWDPVPDHYNENQASQIIGLQGAIWTEFIVTEDYMDFMTYPRLAAIAELGWTDRNDRDLDEFLSRLPSQLERYDAQGINYRIPGEWESPNADQYVRN